VVTLHGHVVGVADTLRDFDLFLLPSVKEGLPYVLLEAGKAMLPVVTTTTGGIPEIVRHEETGLLVQPKDTEHLTKELRRLIVDRKYAKKLGQSLHGHVVQNFSQAKMIVETAKIYGLIEGNAVKTTSRR
jgi:glycosyltransferase involved in cell wall biosynthesis